MVELLKEKGWLDECLSLEQLVSKLVGFKPSATVQLLEGDVSE